MNFEATFGAILVHFGAILAICFVIFCVFGWYLCVISVVFVYLCGILNVGGIGVVFMYEWYDFAWSGYNVVHLSLVYKIYIMYNVQGIKIPWVFQTQ